MGTLKPQSNGPLYSNTVTGTLMGGLLRGIYSDTTQTQLTSTRQREQQLTQFVGRDVINNKNSASAEVADLARAV